MRRVCQRSLPAICTFGFLLSAMRAGFLSTALLDQKSHSLHALSRELERCVMAYLGKFADGRGLPRQRAAAHLQLFFFPLGEAWKQNAGGL
jgi:hypothetical protein